MADTRPALNPWHGLAHPAWWLALGLLALNDHVLKGGGLLPGVVTGKLSDFAGLVVAPVLAAALLGARSRRGVAAAFSLVALGFAAIKVSHAASGAYVAALGALGMRVRNAVDPTDLAALAALPLAWRLCVARPAAALRVARQRLAVALGSAACVATSPPDPGIPQSGQWFTSAFVANATGETIEVRLRWVDGTVACRTGNEEVRGVFLRSAFSTEPLTVRLMAGQTFPLSRNAALQAIVPAMGAMQAPRPTDERGCSAVLVQADNLTSVVVWLTPEERPVNARWSSDSAFSAPGLVLEGSATAVTARAIHNVVTALPADEPTSCAGSITRYLVAGDVTRWNNLRIERTSVQPDGCTRLEAAGGVAMSVCVPEEAIPFRAGDAVSASQSQGVWRLQAERGALLTVAAGAVASDLLARYGLRSLPSTCRAHTTCGAYVERFELYTWEGSEPVAHDQRVDARGARIYFGGAERPIVRPNACGASSAGLLPNDSNGALPSLQHLAIVTGI